MLSREIRGLSSYFQFTSTDAKIYGKVESIRYLALNLFLKPTKTKIRFIWVESSRGRMILMCSDLTIDPITAIELYCLRVSIENMFNVLKNVLGGFTYHFWSKHLAPASRTPVKKELITQTSSNVGATLVTLSAIEKFVNLNILILGMLQLISMKCTNEVNDKSVCWFRTTNRSAPSENVTKISLVNVLRNNINYLNTNAIVRIIREKMKKPKYGKDYRNTG